MTIVDPSGVIWLEGSYSGSKSPCVEMAWPSDGQVGVRGTIYALSDTRRAGLQTVTSSISKI
ncbi:hypothetical protein [Nocardia fusca]|uniref:hypothetical protein n=1 Tax=Nocardia fusca TaxID=941183 RepID=UPI000A7057BA|nr:hypothetical protein [Nocardia fusca]